MERWVYLNDLNEKIQNADINKRIDKEDMI